MDSAGSSNLLSMGNNLQKKYLPHQVLVYDQIPFPNLENRFQYLDSWDYGLITKSHQIPTSHLLTERNAPFF